MQVLSVQRRLSLQGLQHLHPHTPAPALHFLSGSLPAPAIVHNHHSLPPSCDPETTKNRRISARKDLKFCWTKTIISEQYIPHSSANAVVDYYKASQTSTYTCKNTTPLTPENQPRSHETGSTHNVPEAVSAVDLFKHSSISSI